MPCELCDDTGWKPVDVDGVRRVARCECWRRRVGDSLMASARIPSRYQRCELAQFQAYNDKLKQALAHAQRLADAFPVADRGLFLLGPPGVGKTHLAVAVLRHVIRTKGARGLFYDVHTRSVLRETIQLPAKGRQDVPSESTVLYARDGWFVAGNGPTPDWFVVARRNVSMAPRSTPNETGRRDQTTSERARRRTNLFTYCVLTQLRDSS